MAEARRFSRGIFAARCKSDKRSRSIFFLRRVIFLAADVTTRVVVARASGAEPTNHEHHHSREEEEEERGRWDTKKAIDEEGRKIHSKKKVIGFSWCEKSDFGGEISRKVAVRRNFNLDLFE